MAWRVPVSQEMAVSLTFVEKTGAYYTFARDEASLFKLRSFFGSRVLSEKDQSLTSWSKGPQQGGLLNRPSRPSIFCP